MPQLLHPMPDVDDLLGSREAARLLGIDRSTLTRWVRDGRIAPIHTLPGATGAHLFRRSDLEELASEIDGQPQDAA